MGGMEVVNQTRRAKGQTVFVSIGIAAIVMVCLGLFGRRVLPWSQALYTAGWMVLVVLVYFVPSMIAVTRQHRNRKALFILNLLLGWTVLAWIGALVWAYWNDARRAAES
jgi:uncharacterized membrane protein